MEFSRKKLSEESNPSLRTCPVESVSAYALMLAPVYVRMRANGKYVAVKAPLDFFSPAELDRWRPFGSFYFSDFVDSSLKFREAGGKVKALLNAESGFGEMKAFPLAPYEISDAILRVIGPLWSEKMKVEPFFVTVLVNEICDLFPGSLLEKARDLDVMRFERALFRASWAVFLALHLGHHDLFCLNQLRIKVFGSAISGHIAEFGSPEMNELTELAELTLSGNEEVRALAGEGLRLVSSRASRKIIARLERVKNELTVPGQEPSTIYGPRGFIDG